MRRQAAPEELLPEDARFIRENYVHHWGPLSVAGKHVRPGSSTIRIEVPGAYTVEDAAVRIAGRDVAVGEALNLPRGEYRVVAQDAATLRWGDHLPRPAIAPPCGMMMSDY